MFEKEFLTGSPALTHGGRFHADDVFSTALLQIICPEIVVKRVFKVPEGYAEKGLVFDIGGGTFDHHQMGAPVRENGVPYAAFGLLWREIGEELLGEDEAAKFDEQFIQPLDLDDNTGCGHPLANMIADFNPLWDEDIAPDDCFRQAVPVAKTILEKRFRNIRGIGRARQLVENALQDMTDGIVVLPRFAPWKAVLIDSPAEFVVYPSQRGGYSAQVVPVPGGTEAKIPFPAAWAGKEEKELPIISGIPSLRFCHAGRFLIATQTMEDAMDACKKARQQAEVG